MAMGNVESSGVFLIFGKLWSYWYWYEVIGIILAGGMMNFAKCQKNHLLKFTGHEKSSQKAWKYCGVISFDIDLKLETAGRL